MHATRRKFRKLVVNIATLIGVGLFVNYVWLYARKFTK